MNIDYLATALALATFFGISALMALSLNLEYGVAGVPNFGQAMFVSIGAYTAGITYTRLLPWLGGRAGLDPCGDTLTKALALRTELTTLFPTVGFLNFGLTVLVALVVGGLVGYLASYVALRVWEEWYLGLVLLVGSEVVRIVVQGYAPLICGNNGLSGIAQPFVWVHGATWSTALFAGLALLLAGAVYLYCERLVVLGLGKPVPRLRAQVMAIGSAIAALAGVLFAANLGFVSTNDYVVGLTLDVWVMVVLGGVGNNRGALLGALIVTVLNRLTAIVAIALNALGSQFEFNYVRYILFAAILLVMLRYRRQGLLPERTQTTIAHDELRA
jgi:branched-chain amino acid transport system permease protein